MNSKKFTIYQITNTINKMIYIGCHVTENINDKYMGSGTNIRREIKEYGIDKFEKLVLYCFDNEADMLKKEREIVNEEFISRSDTYNIIVGGKSFLTLNTVTVKDKDGNFHRIHKDDMRYLSGQMIHNSTDLVVVIDKNGKIFSVDRNDKRYLTGELLSYTKNKVIVRDKNTGLKLRLSKDDIRLQSDRFEFHWVGKKHTESSKRKIGEKNKIKQSGELNSQYKTCWIKHDDLGNKKIKLEELEEYLKIGWIAGRKIKD